MRTQPGPIHFPVQATQPLPSSHLFDGRRLFMTTTTTTKQLPRRNEFPQAGIREQRTLTVLNELPTTRTVLASPYLGEVLRVSATAVVSKGLYQ